MTYTSPLLALADACPAPEGSTDAGVAWHYGDPHGEQRLLASGGGWVDLSHRGVVTVSGPDRLSWLHSLTTQHVEALVPGGSALDLVLSPHGHVEHELHLVDDGETTWIGVEPGAAEALVTYLDRMRFLLRVEVADVSSEYAVVAEPVGEAHASYPTYLVPEVFGRLEPDDDASRRYVPLRPGVLVGREVVVPRSELAAYVEGRAGAGTWAWEALRVAAAVPRIGHETDHRTIPQEVGWVPAAVHLRQGLLPRAGDRRAGAQPRATAAPPRAAAPRRQRRPHPLGRRPRPRERARGRADHVDRAAPRARPGRPGGGEAVRPRGRRARRRAGHVTFGRREPGNSGRPVTGGDGVRRRRAETMTREGTSYDREDRSCRTRL